MPYRNVGMTINFLAMSCAVMLVVTFVSSSLLYMYPECISSKCNKKQVDTPNCHSNLEKLFVFVSFYIVKFQLTLVNIQNFTSILCHLFIMSRFKISLVFFYSVIEFFITRFSLVLRSIPLVSFVS